MNKDVKEIDSETNIFLRNRCKFCCNWMLHDDHPMLHYIPDKNYPTTKLDSSGNLVLRRITRDNLQDCIDFVDEGLEEQILTISNAKSYLKSEGFNQKAIDSIVDYTQNRICYKKAMEDNDKNNSQNQSIIKDRDKNPQLYDKWQLPSSWKLGKDTQLFVDVPMHLLFLGVEK